MKHLVVSDKQLFQIALNIGNSLDLERMLSESTSALLQYTDACAAEVYLLKRVSEQHFHYDRGYSFYRFNTPQMPEIMQDHLQRGSLTRTDLVQFCKQLPMVVAESGDIWHFLEIPDVGVLTLITPDTPFSESTLQALRPVMLKLAESCKICQQHRSIIKGATDAFSGNGYGQMQSSELKSVHQSFSGILSEVQSLTRALHEWERDFRKVYSNFRDITFRTDNLGKIVSISPLIEKYTGYAVAELTGVPVKKFYFDPQEYVSLAQAIQEQGQVSRFEQHLKNKDRRLLYASINAQAIYDLNGKMVGCEGAITEICEWDITVDDLDRAVGYVEQFYRQGDLRPADVEIILAHRNEAEGALRRLQAINSQILTMVGGILIGIDADDNITHWNATTEQVTGISRTAAIGKPFLRCGIRWNWDSIVKAISSSVDRQQPTRLRHFGFIRPDKCQGWLDLSFRPLIAEEGQGAGLFILGKELDD